MAEFISRSPRMQSMYDANPEKVNDFLSLLDGNTNIYIDYANIKPWANKLGWHIDLKRLKQFFDSISNIQKVRLYYGTLEGDRTSRDNIAEWKRYKYEVSTKPVKKMNLSIDSRTVNELSPDLLKDFIRTPLLKQFNLEEIKYLNGILYRLNVQGKTSIEDWKCNFDVEIGRDMLQDFLDQSTDTFILCGGDSDFESPVRQLLKDGKKVILLATARRIARELNDLESEGLIFFELKKIKEYICWPREDSSKPR